MRGFYVKLAMIGDETKLDAKIQEHINKINDPLPGNIKGDTILHVCAAKGNLFLIKRLIANGARISSLNKAGRTPLHRAAMSLRPAAVQLLIDMGADILCGDAVGDTPLRLAQQHSNDRAGKKETMDVIMRAIRIKSPLLSSGVQNRDIGVLKRKRADDEGYASDDIVQSNLDGDNRIRIKKLWKDMSKDARRQLLVELKWEVDQS